VLPFVFWLKKSGRDVSFAGLFPLLSNANHL